MPSELNDLPPDHDQPQRDTLLGAPFPNTEWSTVLRAQKSGAEAAQALDDLCRRYWYPIYAYLRCRGLARADAQDITQGFFLKAIRRELVASADQEKGRLRTFFLTALHRHLADHLRQQSALKRGGRAMVLPLECRDAEDRFAHEPPDRRDPEKLYLAAWARALLERVQRKLRAYYERTDRLALFEALQPAVLMEDDAVTYRELAGNLDTNEAALRLQVFRIRQRLARLLREEVAETVQTPEEIEEELSWLRRALRDAAQP